MESIENRQKRKGYNIHSDPAMRHAKPPPPTTPTKQRKAGLHDDLGLSGFTLGSKVPASKPLHNWSLSRTSAPASAESDDEIDSLTSSTTHSEDEGRLRITRVAKPSKSSEVQVTDVDGKELEHHPDFPPSERKFPKFKKKSSNAKEKLPLSQSRPSSSLASSSTSYGVLANLKGNENGDVPKTHPKPRPKASIASKSAALTDQLTSVHPMRPIASTSKAALAPIPSSFPQLSPLSRTPERTNDMNGGKYAAKAKSSAKEPEPFPLSFTRSLENPTAISFDNDADERDVDSLPSPCLPAKLRRRKSKSLAFSANSSKVRGARSEPDDVNGSDSETLGAEDTPRAKRHSPPPASSPISERIPSSTYVVDLTDIPHKPKPRPKPRPVPQRDPPEFSPLSSLSPSQEDLPVGTPLRSKLDAEAFPIPSPLSSPAIGAFGSPRRRSLPENQSLAARAPKRHHPAAKPFPMSMSPLKEDAVPVAGPSSFVLPDLGGDGVSYSRLCTASSFSSQVNTALTALNIDPELLCPYCDARLPPESERTAQMRKLLAAAAKRTPRDPRPGNRLGRRADFSITGTVCVWHEFEAKHLPRARAAGWPESIDWSMLSARVMRLRPRLEAIVRGDPDARQASKFWQQVEKELKEVGSRRMADIKNQYKNFERVQPG
jgi:hypothetical protein